MAVYLGSITSSVATEEENDHNWLLVEQQAIPVEYNTATLSDASAMLNQIRAGRSAYAAIKSCPVRRSQASGSWTARYTAVVEVHHAEGVDYELEITKDGVLLESQGPQLSYKSKSESFDVDYNQTQQLGWRPVFNTFSSRWEGDVYDEQGNQIAIRSDITHDDGFAYIAEPVFGTFRARGGLTEYDKWTVEIEHKLGTEWSSSLWAVAWWPAGADRDSQKSAECEIKLPQCVIDAMGECPAASGSGSEDGSGSGSGSEDGSGSGSEGYWTVQVNPPRTATINKCTGAVLKIEYDSK